MNDPAAETHLVSGLAAAVTRPLWRSKLLRLATVMALVGALMWWRAPSPAASSQVAAGGSTPAPPVQVGSGKSGAGEGAAWCSRAPLLFRLSVSYIGGFLIGWLSRKSLKWAIVLGGLAVGGIALARHAGLVELDWAGLQDEVTHGLGWFKSAIGTAKNFVAGYLPSGATVLIGLFMGARRG